MFSPQKRVWANLVSWWQVVGLWRTIWKTSAPKKSVNLLDDTLLTSVFSETDRACSEIEAAEGT